MNKVFLYLKIKIVSIQWINLFLQHTYFKIQYKKTFINKILPRLEKIGLINKIITSNTNQQKIFVPYIETSFVKIFGLILVLKALQIRGAKILILICNRGIPICERFSSKNPFGSCDYCGFINKNLIPKLGFEVIEINNYITDSEKKEINKIAVNIANENVSHYNFHGVDIMPIVEDSLMRYYYGAKDKNSDKKIDYIKTALISTRVAYSIDKKHNPDIILSHMYSYSEFQPYNVYFESLSNTPVFCIKGSAWNPNAIQFNEMDLYRNEDRYNQYLNSRSNNLLDPIERKELYDYLGERFSGQNNEFTMHSMFDDSVEEKNISSLRINKDKKNIFLFANIEWDVGLMDCHILFDDLMSWILFTIDSIKNSNEVHLYIKTHPGEMFGANTVKTVADKILDKYPTLPKNVTLITPDYKIMPYSLFKYIDVGVVLSGTLGLEMSLKGIPVIAVGLTPYGRKGFVHEPNSCEEYVDMILSKNNSISFDRNKLELFTYFYFIKKLIPFNLVEKYYGMNMQNIGYKIKSIKELGIGEDKYLDHICDCILNNKTIEAW
tara:strand:+ start:1245 stop:2897 length:1653 start_codon:yes stop_codon:yes gene_type:complete